MSSTRERKGPPGRRPTKELDKVGRPKRRRVETVKNGDGGGPSGGLRRSGNGDPESSDTVDPTPDRVLPRIDGQGVFSRVVPRPAYGQLKHSGT